MAAAVAMQRATGAVAGVWQQQQQQQVEMGWRELGQALLLLQRAAGAAATGVGSMSRRACSSSRAAAGRRGQESEQQRAVGTPRHDEVEERAQAAAADRTHSRTWS